MTQKEELQKKFKEFYDRSHFQDREQEWHPPTEDQLFDFFYPQIEFWQKSFDERTSDFKKSEDKISHLESTLEAADEVVINATYENMGTVRFQELVNEYNQLKTKSQS